MRCVFVFSVIPGAQLEADWMWALKDSPESERQTVTLCGSMQLIQHECCSLSGCSTVSLFPLCDVQGSPGHWKIHTVFTWSRNQAKLNKNSMQRLHHFLNFRLWIFWTCRNIIQISLPPLCILAFHKSCFAEHLSWGYIYFFFNSHFLLPLHISHYFFFSPSIFSYNHFYISFKHLTFFSFFFQFFPTFPFFLHLL